MDPLTLLRRELTYELGVIDYCHDSLTRAWTLDGSGLSAIEQGLSTALLESFLIHVRVIDEFLGGRGHARKDDLTAAAYASTWNRPGCLSEEHRTQMDKEMAHLTTQRTTRGQWEIHELARIVATVLLDWMELLDEELHKELDVPAEHARRLAARASEAWPSQLNLGFRWTDERAEITELGAIDNTIVAGD
ncbi:MAG: hypothetical protein JST25_09395 [Actinobacteria bacterium]|nr:hypothetical protein [Actinomycetota bacterium]